MRKKNFLMQDLRQKLNDRDTGAYLEKGLDAITEAITKMPLGERLYMHELIALAALEKAAGENNFLLTFEVSRRGRVIVRGSDENDVLSSLTEKASQLFPEMLEARMGFSSQYKESDEMRYGRRK